MGTSNNRQTFATWPAVIAVGGVLLAVVAFQSMVQRVEAPQYQTVDSLSHLNLSPTDAELLSAALDGHSSAGWDGQSGIEIIAARRLSDARVESAFPASYFFELDCDFSAPSNAYGSVPLWMAFNVETHSACSGVRLHGIGNLLSTCSIRLVDQSSADQLATVVGAILGTGDRWNVGHHVQVGKTT